MSDISSENGAKPTRKAVKQLRLNTIKNTRRTLGRLAKDYHADPEASTARFRALCYAIRTMAELFAVEAQLEIFGRLDSIDRRLDELNVRKERNFENDATAH